MSSNPYRLKHPEYREKEKVKDRERKKEKYANDEEYREKMKQRASENYYKDKPAFRKCKTCEKQVEYKPRIVYCLDCYKKHTKWNEPSEFIPD